jgi:hypothetical protein
MGDKHPKVLLIILGFLLTSASALLLSLGLLPQISWLLILNLTFTAVGIYSVRSLYFAILKEAEIDWLLTGTAVGLISFIGFTPDVFMSPWMGYLLDRYPGEQGHHNVFAVLSAFAFVGALFGFLFYSREKGRLPFIK